MLLYTLTQCRDVRPTAAVLRIAVDVWYCWLYGCLVKYRPFEVGELLRRVISIVAIYRSMKQVSILMHVPEFLMVSRCWMNICVSTGIGPSTSRAAQCTLLWRVRSERGRASLGVLPVQQPWEGDRTASGRSADDARTAEGEDGPVEVLPTLEDALLHAVRGHDHIQQEGLGERQ